MPNIDGAFPLFLYIYEPDGKTYKQAIVILNKEILYNPVTLDLVKVAVRLGRKVLITDPGDFCVFHAERGRIFFDGQTQYPEGRVVAKTDIDKWPC